MSHFIRSLSEFTKTFSLERGFWDLRLARSSNGPEDSSVKKLQKSFYAKIFSIFSEADARPEDARSIEGNDEQKIIFSNQ